MDAEAFLSFLTEDAVFVYGSQDPVKGRDAVRAYVAGFFATLERLEHTVEDEWAIDEERVAFVQGNVTYGLPNGRSVSIPFLNLFRLRDDKIAEYRVYVDPTPLAG
jgi:limonene-1,2-epoxide hydrolase